MSTAAHILLGKIARNPDVLRPKATTATAETDPKHHECLARGGSRFEAFKQHKSGLRTAAYQDYYGLEPTPPEARESKPPPMMSQGGFHRRLAMSRIRSFGGSWICSYERCAGKRRLDGASGKPHRRKGEGCHRPRRGKLRSR